MKLIIRLIALSCVPSLSFAFFCPTNFSQIYEGDSIDKVQQMCGQPMKTETKDVQPEGPQEWSYYVPQTVATTNMAPVQGTLKTQITFDADGKAINISVNGVGVGSTAICNGATLQLGDDREKVKAACGDPAFVNKQDPSVTPQAPPTKVTTLIYDGNPPVKLIFMNGKFQTKQ